MTLDDFKAKTKSYRRYEFLAVGLLVLGMLLSTPGMLYVTHRIETFGFDTICIIVTTITFLVVATVMFYGGARYPQRLKSRLGLECPRCRRAIFSPSSQEHVIATGCCRFCGGQVVD